MQTEPALLPYIPASRGYVHCAVGGAGAAVLAYVNTDKAATFELRVAGAAEQ